MKNKFKCLPIGFESLLFSNWLTLQSYHLLHCPHTPGKKKYQAHFHFHFHVISHIVFTLWGTLHNALFLFTLPLRPSSQAASSVRPFLSLGAELLPRCPPGPLDVSADLLCLCDRRAPVWVPHITALPDSLAHLAHLYVPHKAQHSAWQRKFHNLPMESNCFRGGEVGGSGSLIPQRSDHHILQLHTRLALGPDLQLCF